MDDGDFSISRVVQGIIGSVNPGREREDLKLLLSNIQVYLERVEGIRQPRRKVRPHPKFNGLKEPLHPTLARELERRLRLVMDHRLASAQRVEENLLAGLLPPNPLLLSRKQVSLVQELNSDPSLGLVKLAGKVKASPRTTKRELSWLRDSFGFRITYTIDPHRFRLAHYGVFFRTHSLDDSREFEEWLRVLQVQSDVPPSNSAPSSYPSLEPRWEYPILLDYAFDVGYREGYLSCYVPDHEPARRSFSQLLREVERKFLDLMEIHRVRGFYSNVSFECYDFVGRSWVVEADLRTEAVLQFILQHGEAFQTPRGFRYAREPGSFDRADWVLAAAFAGGIVSTTGERRDVLNAYGYRLSGKTVWSRESRLKKMGAVFPYLTFSSPLFQEQICLLSHCPQETNKILEQISVQYPFTILHPTDLGVILLLGSPVPSSSLAIHLHRTISHVPGVTSATVLSLSRLPLPPIRAALHTHWDPSNQAWQPIPQRQLS